jgi:surface antigen
MIFKSKKEAKVADKTVKIALLAATLTLSGCAGMETQQGGGGQPVTGAVVGGVLGGLLGYAAGGKEGAVVGLAAGGALGYMIGRHLSAREREAMLAASQKAAEQPTRSRAAWQATDAQNPNQVTASGWVTPTTDVYQTADGRRCRDVESVSRKDGRQYVEQATLCETSQGWMLAQAQDPR